MRRGTAALAPGGGRIAITDGETVAVVGLREHKVLARHKGRALALGYSPSGRLWHLS